MSEQNAPVLPNVMALIKKSIKGIVPTSYLIKRSARIGIRRGEMELNIVPFLCNKHEAAIDVGANAGVYAYIASQYSKTVFAIEPIPSLCRYLTAGLPSNTVVLQFAASAEAGTSDLFIPTSQNGDIFTRSSLLKDANPGFETHSICVKRQRIDDVEMNELSVSFIKIDVEGHEIGALKGARNVISRFRPSLIIESENRHNSSAPFDVFSFMLELGYMGFFIYHGALHTIGEFTIDKFQKPDEARIVGKEQSDTYINNFIFIHPDRSSVLSDITRLLDSKP